MYISFNGEIIESDEANVSPISEGLMYGYGLFETIKIHGGKMHFFKEHIDRFIHGCNILNIKLKFKSDIIGEYCSDLIQKNNILDGGVRISYTKNTNDGYLLITTRENHYKEETYQRGFKICFSDMKRNPESLLVGIKSNNYLENILSFRKAKENGFDEVIFLNVYEKISEGSLSNIFFVKNNTIYTPDLACGILPGILRENVINIIKCLGLKLEIGQYEKKELYDADEIFITNSLMEIMPVSQLENNKFDLQKNLVTRRIMVELRRL